MQCTDFCYHKAMKLLFLYGPPASGKLTIAENLSTLTKIPLFHNHLSRDLVKDIYGDNLMDHYKLVDQIRFDVLGYCADQGTDLIFTYVYEGKDDDENVRHFIDIIESHGGEVVFIELEADRKDLLERVGNESRKRFKKLTDPEVLANITEDMSNYSIPYVNPIRINTSKISPDEAASLIAVKLGFVVTTQV